MMKVNSGAISSDEFPRWVRDVLTVLPDPWLRRKGDELPDRSPTEWLEFLQSCTDEQFVELLLTNMLPRSTKGPEYNRWIRLWDTVCEHDAPAGEPSFGDLAFEFFEAVQALCHERWDDSPRIPKFSRIVGTVLDRLSIKEGSGPLAWAGHVGRSFSPRAQRIINELIEAIDQHECAADSQLRLVLGRVGLDPREFAKLRGGRR